MNEILPLPDFYPKVAVRWDGCQSAQADQIFLHTPEFIQIDIVVICPRPSVSWQLLEQPFFRTVGYDSPAAVPINDS
jgi:hypothetical protein